MANVRTSGFRIGTIHGRLEPQKTGSEAMLQRNLYHRGSLELVRSKTNKTRVRLVAYEVPLKKGKRTDSVDLIGYDKDKNLYLIELKRGNSSEELRKVVGQVVDYREKFRGIQGDFVRELKDAFFFDFPAKSSVRCLILAPREFYKKKKTELDKARQVGIDFAYFGHVRHEKNLSRGQGPVLVNFY